ncbi:MULTISPECIES: hypothetical protein [Providencia]|nr:MULTISPECIES: hypothetical protein [Providencia]HCI95280.1 hypothetical protein [Providencia sp.]EJD6081269.1 hypothetical protein [Providencia rettgeri]EJD6400902.1 hypothetical protein [Providencia rettgeri]EJD6584849.1 hypothetical protein [Providencia rettgeri]EJD6602337.1 hypothetical protein [Providencia rettgeri]
MFIADRYVNVFTKCHNIILTILVLLLPMAKLSYAQTTLEVIGSVSKGTCSVAVPDKEVVFSDVILTRNVKLSLNDKTYVKPFTFNYSCEDFDFSNNATSPFMMKITAANGTSVTQDNRLHPANNVTHAAFILSSCDNDKKNCEIVDVNSGGIINFNIEQNGNLEKHFEVSIVKLDSSQELTPGELVSSVDITLVQP